ncbi:ras-related GTPase [Moesziomyces antarcticus T-34]|uniref:non-specific serine/threonine protein kinase n=1 Tax=Pseudozyma antarctica (strain T-34) TaxID=1151754 RepID=M9LVW6_PSEA3|nr:ras-related GTPase [Moesziomyces antarcticus T-34]
MPPADSARAPALSLSQLRLCCRSLTPPSVPPDAGRDLDRLAPLPISPLNIALPRPRPPPSPLSLPSISSPFPSTPRAFLDHHHLTLSAAIATANCTTIVPTIPREAAIRSNTALSLSAASIFASLPTTSFDQRRSLAFSRTSVLPIDRTTPPPPRPMFAAARALFKSGVAPFLLLICRALRGTSLRFPVASLRCAEGIVSIGSADDPGQSRSCEPFKLRNLVEAWHASLAQESPPHGLICSRSSMRRRPPGARGFGSRASQSCRAKRPGSADGNCCCCSSCGESARPNTGRGGDGHEAAWQQLRRRPTPSVVLVPHRRRYGHRCSRNAFCLPGLTATYADLEPLCAFDLVNLRLCILDTFSDHGDKAYSNVITSTCTPGPSPVSTPGAMSALPLPMAGGQHHHPPSMPSNSISIAGASQDQHTPGSYGPSSVNASSDMGSVMTEDEEDLEDYGKGGYHPVHVGDTFSDGRYLIVRKLGWGHFSTVWLAKDNKMKRHVALKVVKSAPHYTETALDEIKLLQRLVSANPSHPGRRHCVSLLDHFRHKGPNGSHVCMVFEVLGENLLGLIKRYQHRGVPPHIVKQIAKQVLLGLDYMHQECGIIHTDLKPENVLICIDDVEAVVEAELRSNPAAVPTKLVGVPPSQGRGGTQTPKRDGIFITGSQPLPSPSSSLGSSPMFDKWAFGMSKIDKPSVSDSENGFRSGASSEAAGSKGGSLVTGKEREGSTDVIGHGISQLSTQASSSLPGDSFGSRTTTGVPQQKGPSLLSLGAPRLPQAPAAVASSSAAPLAEAAAEPTDSPSPMSMDSPSPTDRHEPTPMDQEMHPPAPAAGDPNTLPPPPPYDPSSLERITVKIADLGNACWVDHHFTNDIQTRQYRCPEVILGAKWGPSADMWSASCMFFELLTGDYLFDPAAGTKYNKDDDHVAQIIELLGDFPKSLAFAGKYSADIFNRRGELRHIHKLRFWPLISVLQEKYLMPYNEANELSSFLMPMLRLHPEKRSGARELLDHSWIEGIVVQGEIEQAMRQAGIDVDALTAGSPSGMSLPPGLTPSEADALKPVGSVSSSPAPLALNMQGLEDAKRRAAQHQADAAAAVAASQNGALQTTNASNAAPAAMSHSRDPVHALQAEALERSSSSDGAGESHMTIKGLGSEDASNSRSVSTPKLTGQAQAGSSSNREAGSPSPQGLPRPVATTVQ